MLGSLMGKVITAPLRVISVPVKLAQRATQQADVFMFGNSRDCYRAPKRNGVDRVADAIADACEDAFDTRK